MRRVILIGIVLLALASCTSTASEPRNTPSALTTTPTATVPSTQIPGFSAQATLVIINDPAELSLTISDFPTGWQVGGKGYKKGGYGVTFAKARPGAFSVILEGAVDLLVQVHPNEELAKAEFATRKQNATSTFSMGTPYLRSESYWYEVGGIHQVFFRIQNVLSELVIVDQYGLSGLDAKHLARKQEAKINSVKRLGPKVVSGGSTPTPSPTSASPLVATQVPSVGLPSTPRAEFTPTPVPTPKPTPTSAPASFVRVGRAADGRQYHSATLLQDGKVLVVGGVGKSAGQITGGGGQSETPASAEVFNPETKVFSATTKLIMGRSNHTATLLGNGIVLIAGGSGEGGALGTAEVYDPTAGSFSYTGGMNYDRVYHAAVLLSNGKVLVVGGVTRSRDTDAVAELFDPSTGKFSLTGKLSEARRLHAVASLDDGRVLIIGGGDANSLKPLDSVEVYDPATEKFMYSGKLKVARRNHTATLLPDGKVLVRGGFDSVPSTSAELYDPLTGTSTVIGGRLAGRADHSATLMQNGQVLIVGGTNDVKNFAELYDASTRKFSATVTMDHARSQFKDVLLSDGTVLFIGGQLQDSRTLVTDAQLYLQARGLIPTPTPTPTLPSLASLPKGQLIAFTSEREGTLMVYLTDRKGSMVSPLLMVEGLAGVSPSWSPDGERIAFTCISDYPISWRSDVCVVNKDGTNLVNLTVNQGGGQLAAWSPDGQMIAIQQRKEDGANWSDIYLMNSDGSNLRPLANSADHEEVNSWSPDGRVLIYTRRRPGTSYSETILKDIRSGQENSLVVEGKPVRSVSWSPDGSWVAFISAGDIYKARPDGKGATQLTSGIQTSIASWSPDGKSLALVASGNVYVVRPDGTGLTKLTTTGKADGRISWSPDSNALAYVAQVDGRGREVFVLPFGATGEYNLTHHPGDDDNPQWQPRKPEGR